MKTRSFIATLALTIFSASTNLSTAGENLPKVLIIGDSISIGYTPFVRQLLEKEATVSRNEGNAAHTGNGLKLIDEWLGDTRWNVIHFNWGLHDLCYRNPNSKKDGGRDKTSGTLTFSLDQYEENLEKLVQRLEKTGATLIWASTTVVPEGEPGRIAGDDRKYNDVAAKVMKKHGVAINDLHALSVTFDPGSFVRPRDVHYSPAGYQKLGVQVADEIRKVLKNTPASKL